MLVKLARNLNVFLSYQKWNLLTINGNGYIFNIDSKEKVELSIKIKKGGENIMPKLDGTGPTGQGAGTGRGMGSCCAGSGMGRDCYCGYGGRRRFISPKNELSALENEEKMLEEELAAIKEEKTALQDQQK